MSIGDNICFVVLLFCFVVADGQSKIIQACDEHIVGWYHVVFIQGGTAGDMVLAVVLTASH